MGVVQDPIADLLTRIRNGQIAGHAKVSIPASKIKFEIGRILKDYGYVSDVQRIDEGPQGVIEITLKYDRNNEAVIRNLHRVSKPSRRVYVPVAEIPQVLNGLGVAILSTSQGVLGDREARAANVGGEVLCTVY